MKLYDFCLKVLHILHVSAIPTYIESLLTLISYVVCHRSSRVHGWARLGGVYHAILIILVHS